MRGSETVQGDAVFNYITYWASRGEKITASRIKMDFGIGHARASTLLNIWRKNNPGVQDVHQTDSEAAKAVLAVLRARLSIVKEEELVQIANTIALIFQTKGEAS